MPNTPTANEVLLTLQADAIPIVPTSLVDRYHRQQVGYIRFRMLRAGRTRAEIREVTSQLDRLHQVGLQVETIRILRVLEI